MIAQTASGLVQLFFLTLLINPAVFFFVYGVYTAIFGKSEDRQEGVAIALKALGVHLVVFVCILVFDCGGRPSYEDDEPIYWPGR
jgi:hypothetical protein